MTLENRITFHIDEPVITVSPKTNVANIGYGPAYIHLIIINK